MALESDNRRPAIATDGELAVLSGAKDEEDLEDVDASKRNARYRIRNRINDLEAELQRLDAAGEDELVELFYRTVAPERVLGQPRPHGGDEIERALALLEKAQQELEAAQEEREE
jgi:hypothetical protein